MARRRRKIKKKKLTPAEQEAERSRKAQAAADRRDHFENGGTPRTWRRPSVAHTSRAKKRQGTRAQRKKRAIAEQD